MYLSVPLPSLLKGAPLVHCGHKLHCSCALHKGLASLLQLQSFGACRSCCPATAAAEAHAGGLSEAKGWIDDACCVM